MFWPTSAGGAAPPPLDALGAMDMLQPLDVCMSKNGKSSVCILSNSGTPPWLQKEDPRGGKVKSVILLRNKIGLHF